MSFFESSINPSTTLIFAWLPLLLIFVSFAIPFAILGSRRETGRSLISVCATVLAGTASVFIAKLVSKPLSRLIKGEMLDNIQRLIKMIITADKETVSLVTDGVCQTICAFIAFIVLFIIFLIVFKLSFGKLMKKKSDRHGVKNVGGVIISIIDAAVLCLILLLPLHTFEYHTLYIADAVGTLDAYHTDETIAILDGSRILYESVPVQTSRVFPLKNAGDYLMTVPYKNGSACLSEILSDFCDVIREYSVYHNAEDKTAKNEAGIAFIDALENFSTENGLLPKDISIGFLRYSIGRSGSESVRNLADSLNSSNFDGNVLAICDLLRTVFREDSFDVVKNPSEIINRFSDGTLLDSTVKTFNSTDELASFKGDFVREISEELISSELSEVTTPLSDVKGRKLEGDKLTAEKDALKMFFGGLKTVSSQSSASSDLVVGILDISKGLNTFISLNK